MKHLHRLAPELPSLEALRAAAYAVEEALHREHPLLEVSADRTAPSHVAAGVLCSRLHELEAILDWYVHSVSESLQDPRADLEAYPF